MYLQFCYVTSPRVTLRLITCWAPVNPHTHPRTPPYVFCVLGMYYLRTCPLCVCCVLLSGVHGLPRSVERLLQRVD